MKKNNAVEFWRFIFSILVVFYHAESTATLSNGLHVFRFGGAMVIPFFILSGFFFTKSYLKDSNRSRPLRGALSVLWKKVKSFAPIWYICLFFGIVVRLKFYNLPIEQIRPWIKSNWAEFFMLNSVFYNDNHINGPTWYVSALIICCAVYFLLFALLEKIHISPIWVAGVSALVLTTTYYTYHYASYSPMLMSALVLFPVGVLTYYLNEKLSNFSGRYVNTAWQIAEIVFMGLFFAVTFVPQINAELDTRLFILIAMGLVITVLQKRTYLAKILDNPISAFLGGISMGIYMSHIWVLVRWGFMSPFALQDSPLKAYSLIAIETVFYGALITGVVMGLKALWNMVLDYAQSHKNTTKTPHRGEV